MNLDELASSTPNGKQILEECLHVAETLLRKNKAYGDSALNPVRVFSKVDSVEQIRVRIDDKLSRLQRGDAATNDEDTVLDLIGYLVLLRIALYNERTGKLRPPVEAEHQAEPSGNGELKVRGSITVVEADDEPETP
jgi:hypothetical protein